MEKEYLGDSVYVEPEGDMLKLTTDNGEGPTNTIDLEWEQWQALCDYGTEIYRRMIWNHKYS